MPIRHAIWKVAAQPQPLVESSLASEKLLEEMIVAAPRVLSEEWMLIGRQEDTGFGGRIDLLAIAPRWCAGLDRAQTRPHAARGSGSGT
jgi:hypothetical protein